MSYDSYLVAHDDYVNRYRARYGATPARQSASQPINSTQSNGTYSSGISDAGFVANTCTDGNNNDGKIGFWSATGNLLEGVGKGIVNGITGMFTNSEGKFSLGKTLLSVGAAAACIAFPAVGLAACAIGAVSGGAQMIKGLGVALDTQGKSDAEIKAAWENIGAGGSTVVGCALGAKASLGAMKGSSMAAVDDALRNLDNGDDIIKALKGVDKGNIDDVTAALNKAGIENIDDVNNAIGKFGSDTSALGNLDDSLTGAKKFTETAKALGKDAMSSTKNNGSKVWQLAQKGLKGLQSEKGRIQSEIDDMTKALEAEPDNMELAEGIKLKKQMLDSADDTFKSSDFGKKIAQGVDDYKQTRQDIKNAKSEIKKIDATKVKDADIESLMAQRETAEAALADAQAKTPFGKLTVKFKTETTLGKALAEFKTNKNGFKAITSNMNKETISKITNVLGEDLQGVWNFLQSEKGTYAQAVREFGYSKVMQVMQVVFANGQIEQIS